MGERRGGREKGIPNKVTTGARKRALALWDAISPDLEEWIRRGAMGEPVPMVKKDANGIPVPILDKNGEPLLVREGADPVNAFRAMLGLLEFVLPRLARTEVSGEDGGAITVKIVKYGED